MPKANWRVEWKELDLLGTKIAPSGAMGCIELGRMTIDAGGSPAHLETSQLVFCRYLTHVLTS